MNRIRVGGSFAPPLPSEKLAEYRRLAEGCSDRECRYYMEELCRMVESFQQTPRSSAQGSPHPSGRGLIVPLAPEEVERMWDLVPWEAECNAMQACFDKLGTSGKEVALRNAAFHLLWFAKELTKDREPITNDQL